MILCFVQELNGRYQALLQMYGEKEEQVTELSMDLMDVKQMYKQQVCTYGVIRQAIRKASTYVRIIRQYIFGYILSYTLGYALGYMLDYTLGYVLGNA